MSQYIRGAADWNVTAGMINATTGAAFVGTVTCFVKVDSGAQALGTVGAGVCAAQGNGDYTYQPSAAETSGGAIVFTFVGTGAINVTITISPITAAQASALGTATGIGSVPVSDLLTDALMEIQVARAGDVVQPDIAAWALRLFNELLDELNAEYGASYTEGFNDFTITPNLNPHTIGPAGSTFVVVSRPVSLEAAQLNMGGSPAVFRPLNIRYDPWYAGLSVPTVTSSVPTDLYYSPDWPRGSIYLVPVPTVAYGLRLWMRFVLASMTATDVLSIPPAYRTMLRLSLAEKLAPGSGQTVSASTAQRAREARDRVFSVNRDAPPLRTTDSGIPSGRGAGSFNWLTRELR